MTEQFTFGGDIVWRPTPEHVEHANLTAFMRKHGIKDFNELMQRSTSDCLLYTSDAADERSSVDLGGRRIIKKTNR